MKKNKAFYYACAGQIKWTETRISELNAELLRNLQRIREVHGTARRKEYTSKARSILKKIHNLKQKRRMLLQMLGGRENEDDNVQQDILIDEAVQTSEQRTTSEQGEVPDVHVGPGPVVAQRWR